MWESFEDVGFPMSEKVWREKKLSAKYNGSSVLLAITRAGDHKNKFETLTENTARHSLLRSSADFRRVRCQHVHYNSGYRPVATATAARPSASRCAATALDQS